MKSFCVALLLVKTASSESDTCIKNAFDHYTSKWALFIAHSHENQISEFSLFFSSNQIVYNKTQQQTKKVSNKRFVKFVLWSVKKFQIHFRFSYLDFLQIFYYVGDEEPYVFAISGVIVSILALFGIISNAMSIFIFSRPGMRSPINYILIGKI